MAGLAPPEFLGQEWGGQRGVDNFLKGFSLMAAVSAKRNQRELLAAKLENQIQNQEVMHAIAMKKEEDQAIHWKDTAESADRARSVAEETLNLRKTAQDISASEGERASKDTAGLLSDLNNIEKLRGTGAYPAAYNKVMSDHQYALETTGGRTALRINKERHDDTLKNQLAALDAQIKPSGLTSYDPLANPDVWQKDPKNPGKVFTVQPGTATAWERQKDGTYVKKEGPNIITVDEKTKNKWVETYKKLIPGSEVPMVNPVSSTADQHGSEWQKAKAAMAAGKHPEAVKAKYGEKGFDPNELDSDTPP
jgi:hypothetical protein